MNSPLALFQDEHDRRLQEFRDKKTSENAQKLLNTYRALFSGPLVPGSHPVGAAGCYRLAMKEIMEAVSLPWGELDTANTPASQQEDVNSLKEIFFGPELRKNKECPKKITQFGTLDVEKLEADYLSDGKWIN